MEEIINMTDNKDSITIKEFLNKIASLFHEFIEMKEEQLSELKDDVKEMETDFFKDIENNVGKFSDGYHTFDELYEHRITLFIALCRKIQDFRYHGDLRNHFGDEKIVWRSKKHSDGTMFDDYFILGIDREKGKQISYHLPIDKWDITDFAETLDYAPKYDGHISTDVKKRLLEL